VKSLVRDGLSVYRVDPERLRALEPDAIVTQDHCAVCAASLPDVEAALAAWTGGRPLVVSVAPATLGEVWDSVVAVARALGVEERGRALAEALTERVVRIGERAAGVRARPRVACIEWLDPLMGAGNWMPELVALAGGREVVGRPGEHSPWLAWDAVHDADPDVVIVLPCGFDVARTRAELHATGAADRIGALRAAREGRVFLGDGSQFFNRPGPRLAESLEILAETLHPELFAFGHEGRGWERL
jgi:iron complex transport system substrate-binding protein